MRARAFSVVFVLAAADYLVWIWATSGERGVPAVVTGLALPPLAIALAWITLLTILAAARRVAGELGRRARTRSAARKLSAAPVPPGSDSESAQRARRRVAA
jgi:hypothetical protein